MADDIIGIILFLFIVAACLMAIPSPAASGKSAAFYCEYDGGDLIFTTYLVGAPVVKSIDYGGDAIIDIYIPSPSAEMSPAKIMIKKGGNFSTSNAQCFYTTN